MMRTYIKITALFILFVLAYMPDAKGASFFYGFGQASHASNSFSISALSGDSVIPENGDELEDSSLLSFSDAIMANVQINPEVYSAPLRLRKGSETVYSFRVIMHQLSNREYRQVKTKGDFFYSHIHHRIQPVCQYYVFTLRQILI